MLSYLVHKSCIRIYELIIVNFPCFLSAIKGGWTKGWKLIVLSRVNGKDCGYIIVIELFLQNKSPEQFEKKICLSSLRVIYTSVVDYTDKLEYFKKVGWF